MARVIIKALINLWVSRKGLGYLLLGVSKANGKRTEGEEYSIFLPTQAPSQRQVLSIPAQ